MGLNQIEQFEPYTTAAYAVEVQKNIRINEDQRIHWCAQRAAVPRPPPKYQETWRVVPGVGRSKVLACIDFSLMPQEALNSEK